MCFEIEDWGCGVVVGVGEACKLSVDHFENGLRLSDKIWQVKDGKVYPLFLVTSHFPPPSTHSTCS